MGGWQRHLSFHQGRGKGYCLLPALPRRQKRQQPQDVRRPDARRIVGSHRVAPHSGGGPDGQEMVAYQRKKHSWSYYMYRYRPSGSRLLGLDAVRAVIWLTTPLDVPLHLPAAALQKRRKEIEKVFADHDDAPPMIMAYLREAYFFVPLQLALALQAVGNVPPCPRPLPHGLRLRGAVGFAERAEHLLRPGAGCHIAVEGLLPASRRMAVGPA